jgi:hypothetical protein
MPKAKMNKPLLAFLWLLFIAVLIVGWLMFYSGKSKVERIERAGSLSKCYSLPCGLCNVAAPIPTNTK